MNKLFSLISNKKYHFGIFLILIFFLSGFVTILYNIELDAGDDYYFHLSRLEALMQSFKDGTFPSYIDYESVYGYGYLIKPFYSDFVLIPFAIVGSFFSKVFAYKFLLFTMTVLSGIFMYKFVYRLSNSFYAASISAFLYTFSLYRLHDVYNRAALGEILSFTFLPLVFWGLYYIIYGDYKKWYILAIGFSLIIMSHVISSVLLFIIVVIIGLFYYKAFIKEPKRFYYLILSGVVTLVIVSYYIFPFLEQLSSDVFYFQEYKFSPAQVDTHRVSVVEILKSMTDGFKYRIGMGPKIGFLLVFPLFARFFVKKTQENKILLRCADLFLVLGILYMLLSSTIAPWSRFPLVYLDFIQFPSRLFEFVAFFFAIAAGCYLKMVSRTLMYKIIIYTFIFISTMVVIWRSVDVYIGRSTVMGRYTEQGKYDQSRYKDKYEHLFISGMEYYPRKVSPTELLQEFITTRCDTIISQTGETMVSGFARNKYITEFNVNAGVKDSLELPLIYYKGYAATLNGKEIAVTESSRGLVQILVDHRSGRVEAWYRGTFLQKLSFYITILSIFVLCIYLFFQKRKEKRFNN
jgi:hypothetical protein